MKIGIISGAGSLPFEVAAACVAQKIPYFMVGLEGFVDQSQLQAHPCQTVQLAHVGAIVEQCKKQQVTHLVLAGAVKRPSLRALIPDAVGAKWIAQLLPHAFGDDRLLRGVIQLIESEGFWVLGAEEITGSQLLAPEGHMGGPKADPSLDQDVRLAWHVARGLGDLDVGQAVVVQQGLVLGVEAIEGTEALIARCQQLQRPGPGAVLVKVAKRHQDRRVDRPTIGPETLKQCAAAGFRAVAVEAGQVILLQPNICKDVAEQQSLTLIGVHGDDSA
ncbi:MAG: LpxI family protein [Holosporales bacterium]